jgi:uncharacterized protein (DUF4415 family)
MPKRRVATAPERIVRVTADEAQRMPSRTDWARVAAMTEADITQQIADDPDTLEFTDEMLANAVWSEPEQKELVSVRLDATVLAYFRAAGKGYSSRINAVLKSYVEAQARRAPRMVSEPAVAKGRAADRRKR